MAQSPSPIKYQRRSVWAVRTFPKGCGRFAVANPRSVEEPKLTPPPLPPPSSPPPPSPPPPLEKAASPALVSSPHPITSQFNPIVEQNEVFVNRKQFPKRRKVSAIRTFPAGCGREVSANRTFPVGCGRSESKTEAPKPMSIQINNSDKQPSPDTGYDIKTLEEIASLGEEPKPLQVDATFEIKGLGVTQDERREFGGDNMAIPSPRGIDELQESKPRARKIASKGSIKNQKESSEKRKPVSEIKSSNVEPKTPRAEATAVIKKEPAEIQKKGKEVKSNKRSLEIIELEEESKQIVHSGSKVAGESSTPNQRQSSEKVEAVGDRLIVQCLMAAPNCPWRTRSGSATPKASRVKVKQAR